MQPDVTECMHKNISMQMYRARVYSIAACQDILTSTLQIFDMHFFLNLTFYLQPHVC